MLHALPVSAEPKGVFTLSDRSEALAFARQTKVHERRGAGFRHAGGRPRAMGIAEHRVRPREYPAVRRSWTSTAPRARPPWPTASSPWPSGTRDARKYAPRRTPPTGSRPSHPPRCSRRPTPPRRPLRPASLRLARRPRSPVPPTSQSLLFASSETAVESALFVRPWTLSSGVAYRLSGGADDNARRYLPFAQGPLAHASADYRFPGQERDHLRASADRHGGHLLHGRRGRAGHRRGTVESPLGPSHRDGARRGAGCTSRAYAAGRVHPTSSAPLRSPTRRSNTASFAEGKRERSASSCALPRSSTC